jgi:hypothetical protein
MVCLLPHENSKSLLEAKRFIHPNPPKHIGGFGCRLRFHRLATIHALFKRGCFLQMRNRQNLCRVVQSNVVPAVPPSPVAPFALHIPLESASLPAKTPTDLFIEVSSGCVRQPSLQRVAPALVNLSDVVELAWQWICLSCTSRKPPRLNQVPMFAPWATHRSDHLFCRNSVNAAL